MLEEQPNTLDIGLDEEKGTWEEEISQESTNLVQVGSQIRAVSATLVQDAGSLTGVASVSNGGTGASSLTGILQGNGTSAVTAITPLSGTKQYYVSDSSGGAVTRRLTFTNGVLTSES